MEQKIIGLITTTTYELKRLSITTTKINRTIPFLNSFAKVSCQVTDRKLNGECTIEYRDGLVDHEITCHFADNVLEGAFMEIYTDRMESHSTIICTYRNGILHGQYKKLHGKEIVESMFYINGKLDGPYELNHSEGKPHVRCEYFNGTRLGEYFEYFPNGVLKTYCSNYVNDLPNGVMATFDETTNLLSEISYKMGIKHGLSKIYYPMYGIVAEETYDNGILMDTRNCTTKGQDWNHVLL